MSGIGQVVVDVVVALAATSYAALGAPLKHEPQAQHSKAQLVEVRRLPVRPQMGTTAAAVRSAQRPCPDTRRI